MTKVTVSARPSRYFDGSLFREVTEGVAPSDDPQTPFAISYGLFNARGESYAEPQACLWFERDALIHCHQLGSSEPRLSRRFALQGFSLLGWEDLRYEAEEELSKLLQKDSRGETFIFAVTPHGAVLVADDWHSVCHSYGPAAATAALCPMDLNAHDRLAYGMALSRTADALVRFQEQGVHASARRPHEICVTIS